MAADLQGEVVLVTGGARRVGAVIVRRLHEAGANVVVHHHRSQREAQALADELNAMRPGSAVGACADLRDVAALPRLVQAALDAFGCLDALVNNAALFHAAPLGAITPAHWEDLLNVNLRAPLFLAQAAAPHLVDRAGCIVNVADIHGERPLRQYPAYSVTKAGLIGLTRALACELGPRVRVNAVSPGAVLWPEDGRFDAPARERIVARTLLGRAGTAEDVAGAVHYLVAEAPYVTGQVLAVDGGRNVAI